MIEPFSKIRFTKTLTEPACGDHPELLYAREGETGILGAGISYEGYWARTFNNPTWFGVSEDEFELFTYR